MFRYETNRRRKKQVSYNQANNIQPKGISKLVSDIMEAEKIEKNEKKYIDKSFLEEYSKISPTIAMKKIKKIEKKMYDHATNLEFEEASKVRDEISRIKDFVFSSSEDAQIS